MLGVLSAFIDWRDQNGLGIVPMAHRCHLEGRGEIFEIRFNFWNTVLDISMHILLVWPFWRLMLLLHSSSLSETTSTQVLLS